MGTQFLLYSVDCKGFDWEAGLELFFYSGQCALGCRLKKALSASPPHYSHLPSNCNGISAWNSPWKRIKIIVSKVIPNFAEIKMCVHPSAHFKHKITRVKKIIGVRRKAEYQHTAVILTEHIFLLPSISVPWGQGKIRLSPRTPVECSGALRQQLLW